MGNLDVTDHSMITLQLRLNHTIGDSRVSVRDYNKGDYDSTRNALKTTDWSSLNNSSVEEYWNRFNAAITELKEKFIP